MRSRRGFTLVELMIVVVLVGILSTIAFVAYRRWVASSHKAEATSVIGGIATAQEARHAETGSYINVSGSTSNLYPQEKPGPFKTEWGGPCPKCMIPWTALSFRPAGPVMFGYSTVTSQRAVSTGPSSSSSSGGSSSGSSGDCVGDRCGIETGKGSSGGDSEGAAGGGSTTDGTLGGSVSDDSSGGSSSGGGTVSATGPFYIVNAQADTDGNGVYTTAMMYSQTKQIVFMAEGE